MGFSGPVGFGNLGKPGGPSRAGPSGNPFQSALNRGNSNFVSPGLPGFRQGGPVGFGNLGHGGPPPAFMRAGGNPSAPPQSVTTQSPAQPAPQPPGYDSTYYDQLGNATLAANNKINAYNQQSGYAGIDLQNALSQLNYQQGLQTQNAQDAENSRGGFALGHLGQTIGQLNHAYLDRGSQDALTYQRGQAARDAAVAAVRQGLSIEQAALAAAAADRSSTNAAKNPAIGQSSAPLTGGAPPAPGTEGATLPQHPGGTLPTKPGGSRLPVQQALNRSNTKFRPAPRRSTGYGTVRGGG